MQSNKLRAVRCPTAKRLRNGTGGRSQKAIFQGTDGSGGCPTIAVAWVI